LSRKIIEKLPETGINIGQKSPTQYYGAENA
jgi:hypothetical protein